MAAAPGVLRGSGATFFYIATENIPLLAWRGRWARVRTLEHYLQEVAAQVMLSEVSATCRARIKRLHAVLIFWVQGVRDWVSVCRVSEFIGL